MTLVSRGQHSINMILANMTSDATLLGNRIQIERNAVVRAAAQAAATAATAALTNMIKGGKLIKSCHQQRLKDGENCFIQMSLGTV